MKSQASKKSKILVVDDEPDNLDLLYRTFHRQYKVLRAESGPVALEILERERGIAAIVSDQRMPVMSGTELLRITAAQYPDIIRIILTGYTDVEDLVEAINSGKVFKYVTKPWEAEHLKDIVSQAIDTHNVLKIRTDELSRSLRRESLLNTVTNTIRNAQFGHSEGSPLHDVLQTIVTTVGQMLGVDYCLLQARSVGAASAPGTHRPRPDCYLYRRAAESPAAAAPENHDTLRLVVWETQAIEVLPQVTQCERLQAEPERAQAFAALGIQATLMVPLICQLELVATLALHRTDPEALWDDDEIQLALMVADQAALAISQARAYEQARELAQREALVNSIVAAIRSSLDPQDIFMAIAQQLGTTLGVDGCALSLWTAADEYVQCVGLYDRRSASVDVVVAPELEEAPTQLPRSLAPIQGNPVLCQVLATQQPVAISETGKEAEHGLQGFDLPQRSPARALLVVPLLADGALIGSISLRQLETPRQWSAADIELAQAVAAQAAIAVQQSRLYQQTRQQAERLMELDRQKTEFFQNISHEFRTPLTLMLGPLEAAVNRGQDLPQDQAEIALRNCRRLLRLVNQLLDLQRLDAGRMQPSFRPCELREFVAQITDTFRAYCQRKQIALVTELESCPAIYLDSDKFDKVLYNLLSNAMKFTDPGGQITVRLRPVGDRACLQISDTGIGIAADQLPYLFDRFRQAEGSINRSYEGTGLGLALVQEMVKLHGGQVEVTSVKSGEAPPGAASGTTFTVWLQAGAAHLPADQVTEQPTEIQAERSVVELADLEAELLDAEQAQTDLLADSSEAAEPTFAAASPATAQEGVILVVDDNPDLRAYVSHILRSEGYQVYTARNGEEGFRVMQARRPQLVVSDLMMPKVSGLDLIQWVRADAALQGTPIVLLTAKADEATRIEGAEQGADAYLSKPFNDRELLAIARNLLALKANEQRVQELNTYLTESVLKRFLPPEMVARAARGEMELALEPEPRLVTILFSDIVGFTSLSNTLRARRVAQLLNEYLQAMTEAVFSNGGSVDKFMGDAIVALFGAPEPLSPAEQVRRAIAAARAMYRALDDLNARWQAQGLVGGDGPPPVQFRCGIHQGSAVVGMFGSDQRSDYTAIGPSVNIAARLQEVARPNSILVSATVADFLDDSQLEKYQTFQLKGIDESVLAFFASKT